MMNREECLYKSFYCCVTLVEQYVFLATVSGLSSLWFLVTYPVWHMDL